MNQFQLEPNVITYENYIDAMIANDEFERAKEFFKTMKSQNFKPSSRFYQRIIKAFTSCSDDTMVLELMKVSEEDGYNLFSNTNLDILRVFVYQNNVGFILLKFIKIQI